MFGDFNHGRDFMMHGYRGDPHIVPMKDFTALQNTSTSVWALEFYAGWCGHCQQFSPIWRATGALACAASPALRVGAVDCVNDHELCQKMQVRSFPTIRVFQQGLPPMGKPLTKCQHGCRSAREVLDDILHTAAPVSSLPPTAVALEALSARHACSARVAAKLPSPPPSLQPGFTLLPGQAPWELALMPRPLEDLTSAIIYGFEREVLRQPLPPGSARKDALDAWLILLEEAFPGQGNRKVLGRLRKASAEVSQPWQWQATLKHFPKPLLPVGSAPGNGIQWRACRGWSAESRGYPCGLWSLFHVLLAHAPDAPKALVAIRGYVEHFFGCNACAAHFLAMATRDGVATSPLDQPRRKRAVAAMGRDRMPDGVHAPSAPRPADAALWLWRAHNEVNRRLNQSGSEDRVLAMGLRKEPYPDAVACPSCRNASGWREDRVVGFLRAAHCHDDLSACALPMASLDAASPAIRASAKAARTGATASASADLDKLLAAMLTSPLVAAIASGLLLLCVCVCAINGGAGCTPRAHQRRSASRRLRALNSVGMTLGGRPTDYRGLPSADRGNFRSVTSDSE